MLENLYTVMAAGSDRTGTAASGNPTLLNPNRSASGLDVLPGAERSDAPRQRRVISEGSNH